MDEREMRERVAGEMNEKLTRQREAIDEKTFSEGKWRVFASYPPEDDYLGALFDTAAEARAERDRLVKAQPEDDEDDEGLTYFAAWVHPDLTVTARRLFMRGEEALPCFHYPALIHVVGRRGAKP